MNYLSSDTDKVFYFECVEQTAKAKVSVHFHDSFEVYYLTAGRCNYFIDNKTYTICPGDIVLVPQGVIHKSNYRTATHSRMLINCSEKYIPMELCERVRGGAYIYGANAETDALFKRISREYNTKDEYSDTALIACLSYLFICLARTAEKYSDGEGRVESCSEKAVEYIRENYMNKILLADAAMYCCVSPEHLSRTFKRQTGVGFNEYLVLYRLGRAETMLVNQPGFSISDIAYSCGFNDSNYFSTVFKRVYGLSPSEKKAQLLKY